MEIISSPNHNETPSIILPPHNDRMVWAILTTIFCCLVGGIIAIVYSSESNRLYSSAIYSSDDITKQSLYLQSEQKNNTARTWIIINFASGALYVILILILLMAGVLADYL